jgi:hypothetical protein
MICFMCHQEKPPHDFSTLTRMQAYETIGEACTSCYFRQLVLEYPEYQADGRVIYRPYPEPRLNYIEWTRRYMSGWLRSPAVLKKYDALGSINKQVAPFWAFVKGVTT